MSEKVYEFSFNTQPPEGGCLKKAIKSSTKVLFQHTAARRRLRPKYAVELQLLDEFQHTAARRRLLPFNEDPVTFTIVSTHSRPKAAAIYFPFLLSFSNVSTHSRPKAAATTASKSNIATIGFNTQPPEGGCKPSTG